MSAPATELGPPPLDPAWLDGCAPFERLLELAGTREALEVGGLWGSSQALVVAALARRAQGPWLVVTSTEDEARAFGEDLDACGVPSLVFPARESYASGSAAATRDGRVHADPHTVRRRLQAAQQLAGPPERRPRLVVASLLSLLQPLPAPRDLERDFVHLQVNQKLDVDALLERLVAAGYARQPLAERPGEVSLRGDILDVFSFASDTPLRVELFDAVVESLRTFDPESQRSVEALARTALCIASDAGGVEHGQGVQAAQMLSPTTTRIDVEPLRVAEQAEGLRIQSSAHARSLIELARATDGWRRLALQSLPGKHLDFDTRSVQALGVGMREAPQALAEEVREGRRVVVLSPTAGEQERLGELLTERGLDAGASGAGAGELRLAQGALTRGFRLPAVELVVVNHRELLGLVGARRRRAPERRINVRALESFFELRPGDLVVHAVHGVARFVGLERMERAGGEEEHLHLLFADEVSLYVPGSRIDLVQRYVGSGSASPELDRLGGQAFRRRKEKVERALVDLAAELLEIQAKRQLRRRAPWTFDEHLEREFLEAFPYVDTGDQATADAEIRRDLRSGRPMDRLLCGDVGFGKTEVAIRAAFRVVLAGGQVAVLVPTTLLAQQHVETFRERLADFPVEVEGLSRYVTGKRAREVIERTAAGQVDVLVGTHRILSKDVTFARLGLVVIDEEQRFGVQHKEHFKRLRSELDLLTLTATPIPRTLHMSLSGLRDISALSEAPEGRQEIETTLVATQDHQRIRQALLRERNRGGQVFFLHNRVQSIERRARELMALVPECTFAVGHGQMTGRALREVMELFVGGEVDVLVATTIVENGIDIPSAGTILIDAADQYGLAEMHQLRGRVGRGDHKAYCYLLVDPTRPLRQEARERLKALEELTQLGAGFQISMKDLELRGAGNILGPQQSGHIAAVGYDMYCRLLHATVDGLRAAAPPGSGATAAAEAAGREALLAEIPARVTSELEAASVELELGLAAFLPDTWIPSPAERLDLLRRLHTIEEPEDARAVREMLRDRYGRLPPEAERLVEQFELCALCARRGIRRLAWREETYLIEYADRLALERAIGDARVELRPLGAGRAHLVVPHDQRTPERASRWIHALLQGDSGETKMKPKKG